MRTGMVRLLNLRANLLVLAILPLCALLSMGFLSYGQDLRGYALSGRCPTEATYTRTQMREWNRLLFDYREVFGRQGFFYLGTTVRCGRYPTFMVRDRFARTRLERQLRLLGIPSDAVNVRFFPSIGGYARFDP